MGGLHQRIARGFTPGARLALVQEGKVHIEMPSSTAVALMQATMVFVQG